MLSSSCTDCVYRERGSEDSVVRKCHTQLANIMSFDKVLDLTAVVFYLYKYSKLPEFCRVGDISSDQVLV